MACPISAYMLTEKCRALRNAHNLACHGCTEIPTRMVPVEIPANVYERIHADCQTNEVTVPDYINALLEYVASGEYIMARKPGATQ